MQKYKFDKNINSLFKAILSLKNEKEMQLFFRDLFTTKELIEMSERWQIVRLLEKNIPYREIADKLNASTTTVSRVACWLNNGVGGYRKALNNISLHSDSSDFEKS